MKNFLQKLNGWQRLFVVWLVVIQFPVSIFLAIEIGRTVKPILPETIEKNLKNILNDKNFEDFNVYKGGYYDAQSADSTIRLQNIQGELARRGIGKIVNVSSTMSNWNWQYSIYFGEKITASELQVATKHIQNIIDNEYKNLVFVLYLQVFGISCLFAIFVYGFGLAINWVMNGFKLRNN
jgi:hypothetical protein